MKSSPPSRKAPARGGRAFLYVLTAGVFFSALDQTVVVTAIPSMVLDLGIEFRNINRAAWIVNGFLIGYTVALPVAVAVGRKGWGGARRRFAPARSTLSAARGDAGSYLP